MGKHRKSSTTSFSRACGVGVTGSALSLVLTAVPAQADEVDDLIAQIDLISHDATAKVEEVKQIEDDIAAQEQQIDRLERQVHDARAAVDRANGARNDLQARVDGIAASKYRNTNAERLLSTLDSGSPQKAIDRAAYLDALSRNADREIDGLQSVTVDAAARANQARAASVEAEFKRNELDAKKARLEREREELDAQVRVIEERVDNLGAEARMRWVTRYNPVDAAALPAVSSGVVEAAMGQLGKPYGWGATGPSAFDCSGLMVWAYGQQGKAIPRTSQAQLAGGTPVSLDQLQPGDIVGYYPGVTHVGMYIGDGMLVHASDYGIPVQVVPVDSMPIQGAVRY